MHLEGTHQERACRMGLLIPWLRTRTRGKVRPPARRKQGVKLDLLPYTKSKRNGGHRLDGTRVAGIGSCPARAGVDPASARGSSFPE